MRGKPLLVGNGDGYGQGTQTTTTTAQWRDWNDDGYGRPITVGSANDEQSRLALFLPFPLENILHVYEGRLRPSFAIFFCYTMYYIL